MSNESPKQTIYIIAGPTAVGKTALSVELAKSINGEVVSADSMQVYKYMDIGTAKISKAEMQGIPHHMIDIIDPTTSFHVYDYQKIALEAIEQITAKHKVPIIAGGTGFYIQSILYDIEFAAGGEEPFIRKKLQEIVDIDGPSKLHDYLKSIDPISAKRLHENDIQRVIRAIEFYEQNGYSITDHNAEQRNRESRFIYKYFVLTDDRKSIYDRIDKRVDVMMEKGLVGEVHELLRSGCKADMTSMQGIGYKQIINHINGEYDLDEAIRLIKRDSRHYAKRQLTWFNRENNIVWIDRREFPDLDSQVEMIHKNIGV